MALVDSAASFMLKGWTVSRLLHLATLLLVTLMASHALAFGEQTVMVCKFSGKVMKGCPPCPDGEESTRSEVQRSDCCELLTSAPADVPGTIPGAPSPMGSDPISSAPREAPSFGVPCPAEPKLHARSASPPGKRARLHVELCQLLI